jgi:hypothetical protein
MLPAGLRVNAVESYGHAVVLVGYSNPKRYWVVRSSWGPNIGTGGYFKVAYGASGVADPSNTWGLRFRPLSPIPAYTADQISPAAKQGCLNYKASNSDYLNKVAEKFAVAVKQLALDNLGLSVKDPQARLVGHTILVCNAKEVSDVLPPTSQADALLRIKAAIDPNNILARSAELSWTIRPGSRPTTYCTWVGITCDADSNVKKIHLGPVSVGGYKLAGVLPGTEALLALPKLEILRIFSHDLAGTLPESYANLTHLRTLDLFGNKLRGTLPAAWAALSNLRTLSLGSFGIYNVNPAGEGNLLEGTLPKEWGALSNLQALLLVRNQLTGSLPASWGELKKLETLQLSFNQLAGSIPDSWSTMVSNLLELSLNNNRLGGTLPAKW